MWKNAHEAHGDIQVPIELVYDCSVVFVGFFLKFVVELDGGTPGRSKEV